MTAETVRRLRGAVRGRPCGRGARVGEWRVGGCARRCGRAARRLLVLAVGLPGREHVPASGEDVVGDGDGGLLVATAVGDLAVALGEVALVGAGGGAGALGQRLAQPFGALAGLGGLALAGRLALAGTEPGPRGEVLGARSALGKRLMSVPISATMTSAARRSTPGIVRSSSTAGAKGAISSSMRCESASMSSSRSLRWACTPAGTRGGRRSDPGAPCAAPVASCAACPWRAPRAPVLKPTSARRRGPIFMASGWPGKGHEPLLGN
jgi:hypothetical protein